MKILVTNLSKHSRRIRIFQPKSPEFKLFYDLQEEVAAGLAIKVLV